MGALVRQTDGKILDEPVTLTRRADGSGVALEGRASYGKVLEGIVPTS
jgi:hypothetical protein